MPKDNPTKGPEAGKAAAKKTAPASGAKTENLKKNAPAAKKARKSYYKPKGGNGGARPGAGRAPGSKNAATLVKEALGQRYEAFGEEEIEIVVNTAKGQQIVKKARAIAVMEMLFTEAIRTKSISAGIAFLDRVSGKPKQSIDHSGNIGADDQETPDTEADRAAEKAFLTALRKEITEADDEIDPDDE